MSAITLMADIVILNMFLVVCCLPVVTVGAAVRAASAVVRDMAGGVGSRYSTQFLRELTSQWKPVTLYWLILLVLGAGLGYQQWVVFHAELPGAAITVIEALVLSGVFIIAAVSVWFFALASRRHDATPLLQLLSGAVLSAFTYLGRTVVAVAILAGAAAAIAALPIVWAVPLTTFLIPALALYLIRLVLAGALGEQLGH